MSTAEVKVPSRKVCGSDPLLWLRQCPAGEDGVAGGVEAVGELAVVEGGVGGDGDALGGVEGGSGAVFPPAVVEAVGHGEGEAIGGGAGVGVVVALEAGEVVVGVAPAVVDDAVGGGDAEVQLPAVVGGEVEGDAGEVASLIHTIHLVPAVGIPHVDVEKLAAVGCRLPVVVEHFDAEPGGVQGVVAMGLLGALEGAEGHSDGVFHHQEVTGVGVDGEGVEHGV